MGEQEIEMEPYGLSWVVSSCDAVTFVLKTWEFSL